MDTFTPEQLVSRLADAEAPLSFEIANQLMAHGTAAIEALIAGMTHSDRKVRATCALLLDHVADDRCVAPLLHAMRHDPREAVRRCAMHSLVCDGCKDCPLDADVVGALIETALTDRSNEVRKRAVFYLSQQPPDPRAIAALQTLLARDTDPVLLQRARRALERHQPA